MAGWVRRLCREEAGYTVVEMIVTVTVAALVMGAIVPIFFLMNRVIGTWGNLSQARASELTAEEALERDLREDVVVVTGANTLVLQGTGYPGFSNPYPGKAYTFCVSYGLDSTVNPPRLVRTVKDPLGNSFTQSIAHGVMSFTSDLSTGVPRVTLWLAAANGGPPVQLDPPLTVTPRTVSGFTQVCP